MYVGLIDLEKADDKVNREALWQVLRMYDVEGKLWDGIKSYMLIFQPFYRLKRGESEWFRIDSRVR